MTDEPGDDQTYRRIVAGLLEDGEQFAKSRIKLYRAIVFYRVAQGRKAALLFAIAFLVAAAALVALLMALVLSLAQAVGALLAGVIVGVVGLALAALLALWGSKTFPDLDEPLFDDDDYDLAPPLSGESQVERLTTEEEGQS